MARAGNGERGNCRGRFHICSFNFFGFSGFTVELMGVVLLLADAPELMKCLKMTKSVFFSFKSSATLFRHTGRSEGSQRMIVERKGFRFEILRFAQNDVKGMSEIRCSHSSSFPKCP